VTTDPNKSQPIPKALIVIGGGAAGFFCAINGARLSPGLQVTILEKTGKLLSKVKVSGGGRCNVTNALFDIVEMSRRYPRGQHFVKKTFHQFFTTDTIEWFEERGIKLKAEKDGRMFPATDSSQTIIDCLMQEAGRYGVDIRTGTEVKSILRDAGKFVLEASNQTSAVCDYLCVATGGFPKAAMWDWLRQLGHAVEEPVPSLFTFNLPKHPINALMGVSVEKVRIKIEGSKLMEEGPVLITHWGLSGPAVLRLSAWGAKELSNLNYQFKVFINWLPDFNDQTLKAEFQHLRRTDAKKKISNVNPGLPARLWDFLIQHSGVEHDLRIADLPAGLENILIRNILNYAVEVRGKTTFKEEFVTAGGITLSVVDANTMMSKKITNLFFAGEVLNVDGITGGFNFQHAWTSGWIAARSIASIANRE